MNSEPADAFATAQKKEDLSAAESAARSAARSAAGKWQIEKLSGYIGFRYEAAHRAATEKGSKP